ncbi:MAG: hypothetical protein JW855_00705 [Gammaproteobacteria bacterium]|nr:hypothetical protein [Gammaproteobacteria bacterium]
MFVTIVSCRLGKPGSEIIGQEGERYPSIPEQTTHVKRIFDDIEEYARKQHESCILIFEEFEQKDSESTTLKICLVQGGKIRTLKKISNSYEGKVIFFQIFHPGCFLTDPSLSINSSRGLDGATKEIFEFKDLDELLRILPKKNPPQPKRLRIQIEPIQDPEEMKRLSQKGDLHLIKKYLECLNYLSALKILEKDLEKDPEIKNTSNPLIKLISKIKEQKVRYQAFKQLLEMMTRGQISTFCSEHQNSPLSTSDTMEDIFEKKDKKLSDRLEMWTKNNDSESSVTKTLCNVCRKSMIDTITDLINRSFSKEDVIIRTLQGGQCSRSVHNTTINGIPLELLFELIKANSSKKVLEKLFLLLGKRIQEPTFQKLLLFLRDNEEGSIYHLYGDLERVLLEEKRGRFKMGLLNPVEGTKIQIKILENGTLALTIRIRASLLGTIAEYMEGTEQIAKAQEEGRSIIINCFIYLELNENGLFNPKSLQTHIDSPVPLTPRNENEKAFGFEGMQLSPEKEIARLKEQIKGLKKRIKVGEDNKLRIGVGSFFYGQQLTEQELELFKTQESKLEDLKKELNELERELKKLRNEQNQKKKKRRKRFSLMK